MEVDLRTSFPVLSAFPDGLREGLENKVSPWHEVLLPNAPSSSSNGSLNCTVDVLETDLDFAAVKDYFNHFRPQGKQIIGLKRRLHDAYSQDFDNEVRRLEDLNDLASIASEHLSPAQQKVKRRYNALVWDFPSFQIRVDGRVKQLTQVRVLPLWQSPHASKALNAYHFTNSARYAASDGSNRLVLSWVAMRNPYPVVAPFLFDEARSHLNQNACYAPLASIDGQNYFPCMANQNPVYDQFTVLDKAQVLDQYDVELGDTLASEPALDITERVFHACQTGDLAFLQKWSAGDTAKLQLRGPNGEPLVYFAALGGQLKVCQFLVRAGINLWSMDQTGLTMLDRAIRENHNEIGRYLIDPDNFRFSEILEKPDQDLEGFYDKAFEETYYASKTIDQLFCLEKLADLRLLKRDYVRTAHLLNAAHRIAIPNKVDQSYQNMLLLKLESLEEQFLDETMGLRMPASHRGSIARHRKQLTEIRGTLKAELIKREEFANSYLHHHPPTGRIYRSCVDTRHGILEARAILKDMQKQVKSMPEIQRALNTQMQAVLVEMIQEAIDIIGKPKTPFAVLTLGSMGRGEICPYSDWEFAFVIKDAKERDYFRCLARILEMRILNLGESYFELIRARRVDGQIRKAQSITPRGVSMDTAGLSPLGKAGVYELIDTPEKLAEFQTEAWRKKHTAEAILTNAMAAPSLLMGDPTLFKRYNSCVAKRLNKQLSAFLGFIGGVKQRQKIALEMLKGHVEEFQPELDESRIDIRCFNVKKDLYRPLQMTIGSLALYYDLPSQNSFQCIEELEKRKLISKDGANHLQLALSAAVGLRMQLQLFYEKECEYLLRPSEAGDKENYFVIGHKEARETTKIYRVLVPLHEAAEAFVKGNENAFQANAFYRADLGKLTREADIDRHAPENKLIQNAALDPDDWQTRIQIFFLKSQQKDKNSALQYATRLLTDMQRLPAAEHMWWKLSVLGCLAHVCHAVGEDEMARNHLQQAEEMNWQIHGDKPHDYSFLLYDTLAKCYRLFDDREKSMEFFYLAVEMSLRIHGDKPNPETAHALDSLGEAYSDLEKPDMAMNFFQEALAMFDAVCLNKASTDRAGNLSNLGKLHAAAGQTLMAIDYYDRALVMLRQIHGDSPHLSIANILISLGIVYVTCHKEKARQCFSEALDINNRIWKTKTTDCEVFTPKRKKYIVKLIALTFTKFDTVFLLITALKINRNLWSCARNKKPSKKKVKTLESLGKAHKTVGEYKEAIESYKQALDMRKQLNERPSQDIVNLWDDLGSFYYTVGDEDNANACLEQAAITMSLLK